MFVFFYDKEKLQLKQKAPLKDHRRGFTSVQGETVNSFR